MVGGVVGLGVVIVVVSLVFFGGEDGNSGQPITSSPVSSTTGSTEAPGASTTAPQVLNPRLAVLDVSVSCTRELADHPCSNLVDRDPATAWYAPAQGLGSEVRVDLGEPARISEIVITNHPDDGILVRHARIERVEVHFAGSDQLVTAVIEGWHGPYRIEVPLVEATSFVIHIESTHAPEHYGGEEPFDELAVSELRVVGYIAGA